MENCQGAPWRNCRKQQDLDFDCRAEMVQIWNFSCILYKMKLYGYALAAQTSGEFKFNLA